ncbi:MAG: tetratricopeptide repeat protein [Verrucomicrobia bacterium]|nr:tetratricopeptide repeat protein [Verrucomicrobiota bacterium]NBU10973.1 tetratricopeptide repeat protein [Pseudomonadota bacterium]NDA67370.1 tetratricopeptide repeat protein [Verrucomicrobiota bacterium]NDB75825.1 tetratricopeptide repeat protein [Verrucomicrobiota bacterium]NDD39228.1 tetratricopeptide repeat protein [Verrucomicrobiota bacterium]
MNLPKEVEPLRGGTDISSGGAVLVQSKIAAGLAILTLLIFLPVVEHEFVCYDDDVFVTNNPKVAPGITWDGIKWAFTSADIDYWRPVSWLSHMLDIELFGPVAGAHHLTNVLIHAAAAVMLLLALNRLTRSLWPSAIVAALFAWHPLHVESVAWIAERKDVLCGFFFFFTLWAYVRYVEQPCFRRYVLVFIGFLLGVMSKPMIVTLPCVLLLLDYWPLNRLNTAPGMMTVTISRWELARTTGRLVAEKLPLFAVVLVLSISTIYSQHHVGTMTVDSSILPFWFRLINATTSYSIYLGETFWPNSFSVVYPLVPIPKWKWMTAIFVLVSVSLVALHQAQRRKYLLVGWCWYLGVLVPVIGLIQVGEQAHANRYTYLPLVGLFIMLVWLVNDCCSALNMTRVARALAIGALAGLALVTRSELGFWENGATLFQRAIEVTPNNASALNNLGCELRSRGRKKEAIRRFEESVASYPRPHAYLNLAIAYFEAGDEPRAVLNANRAFRLAPTDNAVNEAIQNLKLSLNNPDEGFFVSRVLALAFAARGDNAEAARYVQMALRLKPAEVPLMVDLAAYQSALGQHQEAIATLRHAIELSPTNSAAHSNLGALLANRGQRDTAITHYRMALAQEPNNPNIHHNLALALMHTGQLTEARKEFEAALAQDQHFLPSAKQLAWLLATHPELRDGLAAQKYAGLALTISAGSPSVPLLDVSAAALAAAGNFSQAIAVANDALSLAHRQGATNSASQIRRRIALYESGKPFTQTKAEALAP